MNGQISFDEYLVKKNREYAKTCRHFANNKCYMYRIDDVDFAENNIQCPCDKYEVRKHCFENGVPCIGQSGKGLWKCIQNGVGCYRYCFNEGVSTKNCPDWYEPRKKVQKKK